MDCSPPGPLPWNSPGKSTGLGCILFSRGASWPRDWTWVSCIAGRFFTNWSTKEFLVWLNTRGYWDDRHCLDWSVGHRLWDGGLKAGVLLGNALRDNPCAGVKVARGHKRRNSTEMQASQQSQLYPQETLKLGRPFRVKAEPLWPCIDQLLDVICPLGECVTLDKGNSRART